MLEDIQGLLISRVAQHRAAPSETEDLLQVARLAALGAMNRWRPDGGAAFTTFVVRTVDGALKRHHRDTGWCAHVPRRAKVLSLKVAAARRAATADVAATDTVGGLAAVTGLTTEEVREGLRASAARRAVTLEQPVGARGRTLADTIPWADNRPDAEELIDLDRGLGGLSDADRKLVHLRFTDDLTQREIADRIGCSQMQVSRSLRRITSDLRVILG